MPFQAILREVDHLHKVSTRLECGVKILVNQTIVQHKPFLLLVLTVIARRYIK
jgi:hypothetical protein